MILIPTLLLSILGIVVISSSSVVLAVQQMIFVLVGLLFYFGIKTFDFRALTSIIKPTYIVTLTLLIVVFIIGVETRGSLRWISLGTFNLQPSEFAKVVLVLTLAQFWSKNLPNWKNIFVSLFFLLPMIVLIFKQPDLGTALILGLIWLIMLFSANISPIKSFILLLSGIVLVPLGWLILKEYQRQRFLSFLFPYLDPQGVGYNVIQSTIAIGSGEFLGRGLGRGTQSRLQFLPEFRTDFIFASIAEELGIVGSLIVILLYGLIFFLIIKILSRVGDRFGELLVIGVGSMLFFQTVINIGMNSGLLPITGITLPLLSYGGSSVVTTYIALSLVSSVGKYGLKRKEVDTFGVNG